MLAIVTDRPLLASALSEPRRHLTAHDIGDGRTVAVLTASSRSTLAGSGRYCRSPARSRPTSGALGKGPHVQWAVVGMAADRSAVRHWIEPLDVDLDDAANAPSDWFGTAEKFVNPSTCETPVAAGMHVR